MRISDWSSDVCSSDLVPDHGRLAPWRFLHISGEARLALGEILASRLREREPDASAVALEKERLRFACAPCIITVIGQPVPGHKVQEIEQLLSGGEVCLDRKSQRLKYSH